MRVNLRVIVGEGSLRSQFCCWGQIDDDLFELERGFPLLAAKTISVE